MSKELKPKTEYNFSLYYGNVNEAQDTNGLADPFITVKAVKPDGSHSKVLYKSSVMKNTLNPKWNEYQKIKVKNSAKYLYLEMFDHDLVSKDDFIGRQIISTDRIRFLDEIINFENDDNKVKATARIKIEIKP